MNIWNVLGITATEDKNEIKKAYRNKLRQINPEDEQEKKKSLFYSNLVKKYRKKPQKSV